MDPGAIRGITPSPLLVAENPHHGTNAGDVPSNGLYARTYAVIMIFFAHNPFVGSKSNGCHRGAADFSFFPSVDQLILL